ncbi:MULTISPECIES: VOC family protein [Thermomonospora]|uniref:Catechol 2,3-dioxygenase-like lactoylglutathione lyase family enzyme n=1 Tax=Thermomonospora cellulosilytica TaxID=1411118 RepID=A0A7W3R893_9ACTN|nr:MULTISPECIES: VOC family protein [Thermomonospora]MBA9003437.1 catechol 2,3-dioxygenase-like lactoylglutathione lyase family enzyme [Thermomonospora cellulosilytica]
MGATAVTTAPTTGHVGVNVTDLDRSVAFYRAALGLEVLNESHETGRRFAFLGHDGTLLITLWEQSEGRFPTGLPGLHHLAFRVPDMAAVRRAEQALRELGATFLHEGVVAHGEGAGSGGVFFTDPDGIRLEIYAPSGAEDRPAPSGTAPTCGFF